MSVYGTPRDATPPPDEERPARPAAGAAAQQVSPAARQADPGQPASPVWPAEQQRAAGSAGPVLGAPPPALGQLPAPSPGRHAAPQFSAMPMTPQRAPGQEPIRPTPPPPPPPPPAAPQAQTSVAPPLAPVQQPQRAVAVQPAAGSVLGAPANTGATTRLPQSQAAALGQEDAASRTPGSTVLMGGAAAALAGTQAGAEQSATPQSALAANALAAQAAASALAVRVTAADAAPSAGDSGTVYGGGNAPGAGGRVGRLVRPLAALRIGAHLASDTALDQMQVAGPGTGLLLGHDRDKKPVLVRLFRPEPTRVTLVGGMWAGQLAAFRALALGARVVVFTSAPESWEGFGEWATGRADRVAVMPAERPVVVAASSRVPALLIYDVGLLGASNRPALGPWQTQLTILRQLTAYGFPAVQESNLILMQRLSDEEAFSAGSVLRLNPQATQLLQVLRDDMFALIGGGANRYVWVTPTGVENQQFGAPRR